MSWQSILKNQKFSQIADIGELSADSLIDMDSEDCCEKTRARLVKWATEVAAEYRKRPDKQQKADEYEGFAELSKRAKCGFNIYEYHKTVTGLVFMLHRVYHKKGSAAFFQDPYVLNPRIKQVLRITKEHLDCLGLGDYYDVPSEELGRKLMEAFS